MSWLRVSEKLGEAVQGLKDAIEMYDALPTGEQSEVRHALYQKTGAYGKACTKPDGIMDQFRSVRGKLDAAGVPDAS